MIAAKGVLANRGRSANQLMQAARGTLGQTMFAAMLIQVGLFVTGPLVARMLGVEDRGHLAALTLWPTTISTIAIWGVPTAIAYRRAATGSLDRDLVHGLTKVALAQAVITVIVHVIVLFVFVPEAWTAFGIATLVSLILGPAFLGRDYGLAALQGARNFRWFNGARLSHLAVYPPLILGLFVMGWGNLNTIVTVSVVASVAVAAVALIAASRQRWQPAADETTATVGSMLAYGHRAHLGRLMPVERFRADQLMIAVFLPVSSLGIYAVAIAFTNVLRFMTQAIGYVAFPAVAKERDAAAAKRAMWRYVRMAIALSVAVVLTLEIIGPMLISFLFGEEFSEAGRILQILLPGVGFVGVRRVLAESLRGGGDAIATSIAEAVTGVAFLIAVLPLMRLWELNGVAIAVTAAEGLGLAVLVWFMLRDEARDSSSGTGTV